MMEPDSRRNCSILGYFPLVDHLVQKLNERLLSQENRFLGQYLVPAKTNATAEYKIIFMKPTEPIFQRGETLK